MPIPAAQPVTTADRLAAYLAAETAILRGQTVTSGDRSLQNASLADVREQIAILQRQLAREKTGGMRYALADLSGRPAR
jgi:hypothetical protein